MGIRARGLSALYRLARPVLFGLDAERAHDLTIGTLAACPALASPLGVRLKEQPVQVAGLSFRNRVGLAAGLDKDARCLAAWDRLGFGFIEVGTVTPRPQAGNPRPRLFRLEKHGALINRLGFNNLGVDALVQQVRAHPVRATLGINIGKNADTPLERAADDYVTCLRKVYACAGYVTVNISSPNTRNLRDLQQSAALVGLMARLQAARLELDQEVGRRVPLFLKIAPDGEAASIAQLARTAREHGADGLIVSNTTVGRVGVESDPMASEAGGLSGDPLCALAEAALVEVRRAVGADYPVVGVGGISSGADAKRRCAAGANLIQVYTGFIYRGPALVAECREALGKP